MQKYLNVGWALDYTTKSLYTTGFCSGFNHLNTRDASKHHFASVKNDLIAYTCRVFRAIIFSFATAPSSHFHPLQVEDCDSNLRLVVDENDNGKFEFERVNPSFYASHYIF